MKERPIIMSTESVSAILEGRKTQTRRVINPKMFIEIDEGNEPSIEQSNPKFGEAVLKYAKCPYGKVGDRLWVREAYKHIGNELHYKADCYYHEDERTASWKSPLFMPKRFSRLILEITNIRVERLGEITEKDAIAEGISTELAIVCNNWKPSMSDPDSGGKPNYLAGFWHTWDSIHKDPHNRFLDPWVWVIEFKAVCFGMKI